MRGLQPEPTERLPDAVRSSATRAEALTTTTEPSPQLGLKPSQIPWTAKLTFPQLGLKPSQNP